MKKFARLFEDKELGQLLVQRSISEHGEEVKISFYVDGLGIGDLGLQFGNDTKKADEYFENLTEDMVISAIAEATNVYIEESEK